MPGGADFDYGSTDLDPGVVAQGSVLDDTSAPVPAYLKFMPATATGTGVETFTDGSGAFSATILNAAQDVLIVPTVPGYAPRVVANWTPTNTLLTVDAGTAVTGTVFGPSGIGLANAKVQLEIDGVPSTSATTASNGTFTVLANFVAGQVVTVEAVPPIGSGLARLTATSSTFDLTQPLTISYAAALATTRDLTNVAIQRGGAAVASGTDVEIVGTLGVGGVVATGSIHVTPTATIAIAATTVAGGMLPPTTVPAPALALSAVIAPDAIASVTAVDLTSSVPTAIDSQAPTTISGIAADQVGTPLAGVTVVAVPDAELALAGASTLTTTTGSDGSYALAFAAGGTYDVQFTDPAGRAAPYLAASTTTATTTVDATLPVALHVTGSVTVHGVSAPIAGAAVEVLCVACTGVALERPIGEAASDAAGAFTIAVPDPGVASARRRWELDNVTPWQPYIAPSRSRPR